MEFLDVKKKYFSPYFYAGGGTCLENPLCYHLWGPTGSSGNTLRPQRQVSPVQGLQLVPELIHSIDFRYEPKFHWLMSRPIHIALVIMNANVISFLNQKKPDWTDRLTNCFPLLAMTRVSDSALVTSIHFVPWKNPTPKSEMKNNQFCFTQGYGSTLFHWVDNKSKFYKCGSVKLGRGWPMVHHMQDQQYFLPLNPKQIVSR